MQTEWIFQKSGFKGCVMSVLFPVRGILVTDAIKENGFCFIMRGSRPSPKSLAVRLSKPLWMNTAARIWRTSKKTTNE